jgi:hypothetical protein
MGHPDKRRGIYSRRPKFSLILPFHPHIDFRPFCRQIDSSYRRKRYTPPKWLSLI